VVFLLGEFFDLDLWGYLWPLIIIAFGLLFFIGMATGGRQAAPLAVPGSIITTIGLILLVQSITGLWASWAYAWALIPTAVGVGLLITGRAQGQEGVRQTGSILVRVGLVLFLVFGAFFELLLNISGRGELGGLFWSVLLIGLGLYLLLRPLGLLGRRS
jgi:hypothetical protein